MEKNNIVIDIETLGRRNDAAITQVGIVVADSKFNVMEKYLIQVTPSAWHTCNRTFTGDTLLWWLKQNTLPYYDDNEDSEDLRHTSSFLYAMDYKDLTEKISKIFYDHNYNVDGTIVWTKGTMDLFCIKDLYEYFDKPTPWMFWQPRDIRTAKEFIKDWKTFEENTHNALSDAVNQLRELRENLHKK